MNYYKVIIVDDDHLLVDFMLNLINWEKCGFTVSDVAYNGEQALKLFRENPVSLIITDIKMPLMGGLELIKKVKEINPNVRTILLTAYDEFELARDAIDLNVDGYIIKDELSAGALIRKLTSLRDTLIQLKQISTILFQNALMDFLKEDGNFIKQHYRDSAVLDFFAKPHSFVLIHPDRPYGFKTDIRNKKQHLDELTIRNASVISNMEIEQCGILPDDSIVLFLKSMVRSEYQGYQYIQNFASGLKALMSNKGDRYTLFYTYQPVTPAFLREFLKKDLDRFVLTNGSGKLYKIEKYLEAAGREDMPLDEEKLYVFFKAGDTNGISDYLKELMDPCRNTSSTIEENVDKIFKATDDILLRLGQNTADYFDEDQVYDIFEIYECIFEGYRKLIEDNRNEECRTDVRLAIEFIKENYASQNLSIKTIADHIGISNSRLSVIFKEDTGKTVNQYITLTRIKMAQKLFDEGGFKVYEVAEKVGYGTSQYFSKVFYRETGYYPEEYKRRR